MKFFKRSIALFLFTFIAFPSLAQDQNLKSYLTYNDPDLKFTGGIKMVPIETDLGTFNVYTRQIGNNPKMRVLLLHGGPGVTHEIY